MGVCEVDCVVEFDRNTRRLIFSYLILLFLFCRLSSAVFLSGGGRQYYMIAYGIPLNGLFFSSLISIPSYRILRMKTNMLVMLGSHIRRYQGFWGYGCSE